MLGVLQRQELNRISQWRRHERHECERSVCLQSHKWLMAYLFLAVFTHSLSAQG